jgi:hypothetical protein
MQILATGLIPLDEEGAGKTVAAAEGTVVAAMIMDVTKLAVVELAVVEAATGMDELEELANVTLLGASTKKPGLLNAGPKYSGPIVAPTGTK